MNEENLLEERLERLQAGESFEEITAGLPQEEKDLLLLASHILSIPRPQRDARIVHAQRQNVMRALKDHVAPQPRFRLSWKWMLPVGAALFLCFAVAAISTGLFLTNRETPDIADASPEGNIVKAPNTEVASNETPFTGQTPAPEELTPVYFPEVVSSIELAPDTAGLYTLNGIVQILDKAGSWQTIHASEIKSGDTLRTGQLSSANLLFFDGSYVSLGANTEVTIVVLNAKREGARQIEIYQPQGETSHTVAPSEEEASYIVHTPSASGEAKGTTFQVNVLADKTSHFSVMEGEVEVIGQQVTVNLNAGQTTSVKEEDTPSEPAFWIIGEGEVAQTGEVWIIGGLTFNLHDATEIFGAPRVGDLVAVHGRMLVDGTRLADRIALMTPVFSDRFRLRGFVDSIGETLWTVSGQEIQVTTDTIIEAGILVDDQVLVKGVIETGGILQATHIKRINGENHFELTGLVEEITGPDWTISGALVTTDENTEYSGDPEVGDLVHVEGLILEDGTWLAREIEQVSEADRFEFTGIVESIAPWLVSGVSFQVDEYTLITPGIVIGSLVRVEGLILDDGTWLASEVVLLSGEDQTITFIGIVDTTDPWIVNGLPLITNDNTQFVGDIQENSLVRVHVLIQEDSTWLVLQMELIETGPVVGCIEFVDIIAAMTTTHIILANGPPIPVNVIAEIVGNMQVGSDVLVKLCFNLQQEIVYCSIHVLDDEPIDPPPTIEPPPPTGNKVTVCHVPGGNPKNAHTITVDESSVDAHLAHGDYLGPCVDQDNNNDKDDKKDPKDNPGGGKKDN